MGRGQRVWVDESVRVRRFSRWVNYGFAALFAGLAPVVLLVWPLNATAFVVAATDVLMSVYAWRCARAGVTITREGLAIRNPWSTRLIQWSDVRTIRARTLLFTRTVAFVETTNGERVDMWSIQGVRWQMQDNWKVTVAVGQLREALLEETGRTDITS